jgi:hypothetical protein
LGGRVSTPIPIYITPFYNSKGLQIDVGPFSKDLAAATPGTIADVAAAMKNRWDDLSIEAMWTRIR